MAVDVNAGTGTRLMSNFLLYHIASGHAFFTGCALIAGAIGSSLVSTRRIAAYARTILALLGAALIAVSATPLFPSLYLVGGVLLAAWFVADRPAFPIHARVKVFLRGGLAGVLIAAVLSEVRYHVVPQIPFPEGTTLFVVGDSVSAGMSERENTWPRRLAATQEIDVQDFSRVGAVAESAMQQAEKVHGAGVVLVEIGGNDILDPNGGTPVPEFERHLHELLKDLKRENRRVVMFELPLPPFANGYGVAQRSLATTHGVTLVPKRVLFGILTADGATVDTIHLSDKGHALMAETVRRLLLPTSP